MKFNWWKKYYNEVKEEESEYAMLCSYHIGDSIPGYSEYKIIGFLEAKDKYYDRLADNGLEFQLLMSGENETFPGYEVGMSLCSLDYDEVMSCIRKDNE